MEREVTPPPILELNDTSERFNKIIQWKIRALMLYSDVSKSMWTHAVKVAVHIHNKTSHKV